MGNLTLYCPKCGSKRMNVPDEGDDTDIVSCADCNEPIATMDDIRKAMRIKAKQVIHDAVGIGKGPR